jgi:Zn-dependent protease with chaperone function
MVAPQGEKMSWDNAEAPLHTFLVLLLWTMFPWFVAAPTEILVGTGEALALELPFSRAMESEADKVGLLLMARACFDPAQGPRLFEALAEAEAYAHERAAAERRRQQQAQRQARFDALLQQGMSRQVRACQGARRRCAAGD